MNEFFIVLMMGFVPGALGGTIISWIMRTWFMNKKQKIEIDEIKKSHKLNIEKLEQKVNELKNHLAIHMDIKSTGDLQREKKIEKLQEENNKLLIDNQTIHLTLNAIHRMAPQYQQENNLSGLISFIECQSSTIVKND